MSKRHLTKQQRRRILENQRRAQSSTDRRDSPESQTTTDGLGPEQTGRITACYGNRVLVESDEHKGEVHRCYLRANLPSIVTGDRVTWQNGESNGVVVAISPRSSELCRPDNRGKLRPVAANIDCIAVVIAPFPEPHANLIDRYLVAAERQGIQPILILNKIDLIAEDHRETLVSLMDNYRKLGYDCLLVSAHTGKGIDELTDYLSTRTSVFVGQSGVGKSSLLNSIAPGAKAAVGALSESAAKGTHTTTTAQLFHLPSGGEVIDSPGIREFGLWHIEPDAIADGFVEFRAFLGHCRFRDCRHQGEPGCALRQAIASGSISATRFRSYQQILQSLESDQQ